MLSSFSVIRCAPRQLFPHALRLSGGEDSYTASGYGLILMMMDFEILMFDYGMLMMMMVMIKLLKLR